MESDKTMNIPPGKIDYKDVLSETDFALFCRLRDVRKIQVEKHGLPVYAVFTNEPLAEIARRKPRTGADLMKIDGIGAGKAEKFAAFVIGCVTGDEGETGGVPSRENLRD